MPKRKKKYPVVNTRKPQCRRHKLMTKFFLNLPVDYKSHYLDSGSFALWSVADRWSKNTGRSKWEYYDLPEFWEYMDQYGKFVKDYAANIDLFSNVDVIPNPELTYRNQKYLENKFGIKPVPVVHFTEDLKWIDKYIEEGHEIIGIGGLVGSPRRSIGWLNRVFHKTCPSPSYLPTVKLHGFGVGNLKLMLAYPWYSIDHTTWAYAAKWGQIWIPRKRYGKFDHTIPGIKIFVTHVSPYKKKRGKHIDTLSLRERKIVDEWMELVDIPMGKTAEDGTIIEYGAENYHPYRCVVNIEYFERAVKMMPEWPWPFHKPHVEGFGL